MPLPFAVVRRLEHLVRPLADDAGEHRVEGTIRKQRLQLLDGRQRCGLHLIDLEAVMVEPVERIFIAPVVAHHTEHFLQCGTVPAQASQQPGLEVSVGHFDPGGVNPILGCGRPVSRRGSMS